MTVYGGWTKQFHIKHGIGTCGWWRLTNCIWWLA